MADETATERASMQDITNRVEAALFPEEGPTDDEVVDDEVSLDANELPEDDDSEFEDDEEGGYEEDDGVSAEEGEEDMPEVEDDLGDSIAAYLGVADDRIVVNDEGEVMFTAIIDGETKQVPLTELAANYQMEGHVNNKSMALEKERQEFEEVREEASTQLQMRLDTVDSLAKYAEETLVAEFNGINWERLRMEDPGNWTARRQEYAERAQKIQQLKDLSGEHRNAMAQEQQQKFEGEFSNYVKEETRKLIAANPKWADDAVRKQSLKDLSEFVQNSYGFTADEMKMVSDHRLIAIFQDAEAYRTGTKKAEEKKLKKVPKFRKPGMDKQQAQGTAKARKTKRQMARVKKTGHVNDVAAAIVDRM